MSPLSNIRKKSSDVAILGTKIQDTLTSAASLFFLFFYVALMSEPKKLEICIYQYTHIISISKC